MQAGGVLEERADDAPRAGLVGERLGGAAERAQVLEHAFGVAALLGVAANDRAAAGGGAPVRRRAAGGDHDVPERAPGGELGAAPLQAAAEAASGVADRLAADAVELVRGGAGGDQVAVVRARAAAMTRLALAGPTPRRGDCTARRKAWASAGLASRVR